MILYSPGSQSEREERCMRRRCIHWTFRSQSHEQLHSMKHRGSLPKEEHSSLYIYLLLCSLFTQKKELFCFLSHLTWINWWGSSPWLLQRTISCKMDFVYATLQVLIFFLFLHHALPFCPPSEPLWLLHFASFLPVCYPSFSSIFLPLLLSVILPSHHPPDCFSYPLCCYLHPLFVFSGGLSPSVWILSHPTALISAFSPVCFCCWGLDTRGVTYRISETTQPWGSKEINTMKRLGGGTDWSICWHHAARPASGSSALPTLFCWKDAALSVNNW